MSQVQKIIAVCLTAFIPSVASSSNTVLTSNGYSGHGLLPNAQTIAPGVGILDYSTALPGALDPRGHNNQVGFGLAPGLELVGRLATQDLHCNMFRRNACPPNIIRDFSASLKWTLPIPWLDRYDTAVAVGMSDVGGAAARFKSYYAVASKKFGPFGVNLGAAEAKGDLALLKGEFFGVDWSPTAWSKLSVQQIGSDSWASAAISTPSSAMGITGNFSINRSINRTSLTPAEWVGFGITIPLDGVAIRREDERKRTSRVVKPIDPKDLSAALKKRGFYDSAIGELKDGTVVVSVDNVGYLWNALDAAGVALGEVAAAYGNKSQRFILKVTARKIEQLQVRGDAACVKEWLQGGPQCRDMSVSSSLTADALHNSLVSWSKPFDWWSLRPELVVSPTVTSAVGTEYGALDLDIGVNMNLVVPLWKGATWEVNRLEPLDINTRDFQRGGVFYASRFRPSVSRRMAHQIVSLPQVNTQFRASLGRSYTTWEGGQIEMQTLDTSGRHRLNLTAGRFEDDRLTRNNIKEYQLASYRIALDRAQKYTSEITYGKFWNGDTGYMFNQKFWHGDTAISVYIRQTRMTENSPTASFAGLQFSIPFTSRGNTGAQYLSARGVTEWTYSLESRIFERENLIGGGFGVYPRMGDTLQQTFNRDRNGTGYLRSEIWRLKDAFVNLQDD